MERHLLLVMVEMVLLLRLLAHLSLEVAVVVAVIKQILAAQEV
jgi:hypothetical protein